VIKKRVLKILRGVLVKYLNGKVDWN